MNKMKDLKKEVLKRLQHLDGMLIDDPTEVKTEAMLGIVDIGEEVHHQDREGTLLDKQHEFWSNYMRDINSSRAAEKEARYAMRLLREEGDFALRQPSDAEVPGVYVSVGDFDEDNNDPLADYDLEIEQGHSKDHLLLKVETDDGLFQTVLHKK